MAKFPKPIGEETITKHFPRFLRIGVVPITPFIILNNDKNNFSSPSGILAKYFETLSETLHFQYDLIVPPDRQWGSLKEDGNWTGMVSMIQKGELDTGFLTINSQRLSVVDFSIPCYFEDVLFITNIPSYQAHAFSYMYAFQPSVWISCFITLLLISVLFRYVLKKKYTYIRIIFDCVGSVLKQPPVINDNTLGGRFLIVFWHFFTLVITCGYLGGLSSMLSVPVRIKPIHNFLELFEAVAAGKYKCFIRKGSINMHLLEHAKQKHLRSLADFIRKNRWFIDKPNPSEFLQENTALILTKTEILWTFGSEIGRTKYVSDDILSTWYSGLAFKKGFCCIANVNAVISRLHASGLYEKFSSDSALRLKQTESDNITEINYSSQTTAKDIEIFIIILAIGCFFSFLVLLCEICYNQVKKRKSEVM